MVGVIAGPEEIGYGDFMFLDLYGLRAGHLERLAGIDNADNAAEDTAEFGGIQQSRLTAHAAVYVDDRPAGRCARHAGHRREVAVMGGCRTGCGRIG